ncbi:MAG: toxin-antitoxin system protein [Duncaniella sp.]|nr:toxin-antitoxin system protein [Bacteroides sp.]MDE6430504.1 toxin-antitoxin system protein [Duncaniella sp.]MDE6813935.1 toxin-antitoxin system protein [Duncaniella sp.]MDE6824733.1 toxin-antitoxin system protein [Duncaniella sp.]
MDIAIQKKAQSFRLPIDLIERLKQMARKQNRSLNNFVETLLLDAAYNEPNEETIAAIEEARRGELQGPLDVSSVEAMYKSMGL